MKPAEQRRKAGEKQSPRASVSVCARKPRTPWEPPEHGRPRTLLKNRERLEEQGGVVSQGAERWTRVRGKKGHLGRPRLHRKSIRWVGLMSRLEQQEGSGGAARVQLGCSSRAALV